MTHRLNLKWMTNRLNIEYEMNDTSISTILVFSDFRNLLICSVTGMNMNVMNLETNSLNGKKGLSLHYFHSGNSIVERFFLWWIIGQGYIFLGGITYQTLFRRGGGGGPLVGKRVRCLTKILCGFVFFLNIDKCFFFFFLRNDPHLGCGGGGGGGGSHAWETCTLLN